MNRCEELEELDALETGEGRGEGLGEGGFSLVELMIAMVLFVIVVASVNASVGVLTARSSDLSESSQAINQLQIADQTLVTDLHASTGFYTSSCSGTLISNFTVPTNYSKIYFTVDLDGSTPCVVVTLSNNTLTVTNGSANSVTVSNLDSTSSISVSCTTDGSSTYCTSADVTLKLDSPRAGAPHAKQTILADPSVGIWNQEYACELAGAMPC
jgi:prepilin-type N-terminal cleavage/methylation domain-containing protein